MSDHAAGVALAYAALRAAAHFGDFWVQTDCQAMQKGLHKGDKILVNQRPGDLEPDAVTLMSSWVGRLACGRHVATYVGTQLVALLLVGATTGHGWGLPGLLWGLAASGTTHYWADRRRPLERLADLLGKGEFYRRGEGLGRGSFHLDQAWHHLWELVATVMIGVM